MEKLNNFEHLVYGDRGLVLTKFKPSTNKLVSPMDVAKFLITLNEIDYSIKNANELFSLSANDFKLFEKDLIDFLGDFDVDGFMFRNSFANTLELSDYTNEEWVAIFAQYSMTYGHRDTFTSYFGNPEEILENYFSKSNRDAVKLNTNTNEIVVSFDYERDAKKILSNILESKIVLREHQIEIINSADLDLLKSAYITADITIKDNAVFFLKRVIDSGEDIDYSLFKDLDILLRCVVYLYSFDKNEFKENRKLVPFTNSLNEQLNNTMLKNLIVKLPTKMKKIVIKAIDMNDNISKSVENMFKYYGFWKKVLTASRYDSDDKIALRFPNFYAAKVMLYENDRSNTLNARVENAKFKGDYLSAVREISENPGQLVRNLLEYVRYEKGDRKAKKAQKRSNASRSMNNNIDFGSLLGAKNGVSKKTLKNTPAFSRTVKTDAFEFFKSGEFSEVLSGKKGRVNTKLLWQALSMFDDDKIYNDRDERYINATKTFVHYDDVIPGVNKKRAKVVKKELRKGIKNIKKSENVSLGKVYIDKALKNSNIEFSGRSSNGINLSGQRLTPGSKIDLSEFVGQNKIIRMGIAWRGDSSCDIDHSINLFKAVSGYDSNQDCVYYGNPTLSKGNDVVISSSGDITQCGNDLFSTELIDIDLDKAINYDIGNMVSSAIQFSGKTFDNYEVLWFFNIIDKKDRITAGQRFTISLDQMDYAMQINEQSTGMLGFHIDLQNRELEVLNVAFSKHTTHLRSNAATNKQQFEEILKHRVPMLPVDRVLKDSIKKSQIVDSIEDADIAFVSSDIDNGVQCSAKVINVSKNAEELHNVIF